MPTQTIHTILPALWGLPKSRDDHHPAPLPWCSPTWTSRTIVSSLFPSDLAKQSVIRATLKINEEQHLGIRRLFSDCAPARGESIIALCYNDVEFTCDSLYAAGLLTGVAEVLEKKENAEAYKDWKDVSKQIWKHIGLNRTMDTILKECGYHPLDVMAAQGLQKYPTLPKYGMDAVVKNVALTIFGPEILTEQNGTGAVLSDNGQKIIYTLVSLAWHRHRQDVNRRSNGLSIRKDSTDKAWQGIDLCSMCIWVTVI